MLDTNVISMLSPSRAEASARFLEWLERVDGEGRVFPSVVAIHDIEKGIWPLATPDDDEHYIYAVALR